MSTIRLAQTEQLNEVFEFLEEEYKPLSRAEILKLALAELLTKTKERKIVVLDSRSSKDLHDGLDEIAQGKYKSFSSLDDLQKDLTN